MHHDLAKLSYRQKEIVRLLAENWSVEAIARRLSLSNRTIRGHQQLTISLLELEDETALIELAKSVYL
ncbi:LuxR C-terminal-related transcriptional regulator [Spirosoma liriopis]|uniref:LuxR C-terminal-related transcriptional regulator n=1 Tax=Spirosoma liriopis TaxID=2937440 RepID=UPI003390567E